MNYEVMLFQFVYLLVLLVQEVDWKCNQQILFQQMERVIQAHDDQPNDMHEVHQIDEHL